MNSFLYTALACLVATASADVTCDECKEFGGAFQAYLMSADSVAEQTELLAAILCPAAEDSALCEEYVRTFWGELLLPCTPSSWTPPTCARSSVPAPRRPSSPLPPVTNAEAQSPKWLESSALIAKSLRSLLSSRMIGAQELKTQPSALELLPS